MPKHDDQHAFETVMLDPSHGVLIKPVRWDPARDPVYVVRWTLSDYETFANISEALEFASEILRESE